MIAVIALIAAGSSEYASHAHTSRVIDPVVHYLTGGLTPAALAKFHVFLRTCAHVFEYALLGFFIARAAQATASRAFSKYRFRLGLGVFLGATAVATADEWRQAFSPLRTGCLTDVLLDAVSALAGILTVFALDRVPLVVPATSESVPS